MLNLNFALYAGQTLLQNWWEQVKTHFAEVQDAHNALETALGDESASRESDKAELAASISRESSARQDADNALTDAISGEENARISADNALSDLISAEREARENGDGAVQESIKSEAASRAEADNALRADIAALGKSVHEHKNIDVLGAITEEAVRSWNDAAAKDDESDSMFAYYNEMCIEFLHEFKNLYYTLGITLYDGGTDGEEQTDGVLDGGSFDEEPSDSFDCGTFDSSIFAGLALAADIADALTNAKAYTDTRMSVIDGGAF